LRINAGGAYMTPNRNHIMNIPLPPVLAMLTPTTSLVVFIILLMMFGAKKLPELAKGLGQAIREFSKAKNEIHDEILRDPPAPPVRQIDTPVQTAAVPTPAGTQPTSVQQPAAPVHHTETHV
jgi:sec-independent protein translocase protein TatA